MENTQKLLKKVFKKMSPEKTMKEVKNDDIIIGISAILSDSATEMIKLGTEAEKAIFTAISTAIVFHKNIENEEDLKELLKDKGISGKEQTKDFREKVAKIISELPKEEQLELMKEIKKAIMGE